MRFVCSFLLLLLTGGVTAQSNAGEQPISHYILDSFSHGTVLMRSGQRFEELLNYNALTGEMIFYSNGKYLAIASPEDVDTVSIGGRPFVRVENRFYELLVPGDKPLFVSYSCTIKEPGSSIGYGMSSTTTAVTPVTALIQSGGAYQLHLPAGYTVIPARSYYIFTGGRYKPVSKKEAASLIKTIQ